MDDQDQGDPSASTTPPSFFRGGTDPVLTQPMRSRRCIHDDANPLLVHLFSPGTGRTPDCRFLACGQAEVDFFCPAGCDQRLKSKPKIRIITTITAPSNIVAPRISKVIACSAKFPSPSGEGRALKPIRKPGNKPCASGGSFKCGDDAERTCTGLHQYDPATSASASPERPHAGIDNSEMTRATITRASA